MTNITWSGSLGNECLGECGLGFGERGGVTIFLSGAALMLWLLSVCIQFGPIVKHPKPLRASSGV